MRTIRHAITGLSVVFLALSLVWTAQAQPHQLPPDLVPIAEVPPSVHNWYSIQRFPWRPPSPCNWLRDSNLVLYISPSWGSNAVWVGDEEIYYRQRDAEAQVLRLAARAANGRLSPDDNSETEGPAGFSYTSNDLWLEPVSLTNDSTGTTATLLIHAPQPSVFDLFYAPSLPPPGTQGWYWIARALPGETNLTVPNLPTDAGFFILGTTNGDIDPTTGLTAACMALVGASALTNDWNTNGIPDIWEVTYLGGLQPGTIDYDGDGLTLQAEWQAGIDPNKISFVTFFSNDHVNSNSVSGTIQVQNGVPAQMAILVNSTNFLSATWLPFSPGFTATLPAADGAYDVWVGLRGRAPNSMQTWLASTIWRDTAPPQIFITNPLTNIDSRPLIQIKGYSPEPITLAFNVTNALGVVRQGTGLLVGQLYDTNTLDLSTCSFECLDIRLALGTNYVGLSATDRAGNLTQTNLLYVFDTNGTIAAPVITVTWPRDGAKLSANTDSFTLLGRLDDETASVVGQIVSPDGTTNTLNALVERNGKFWVQGLSLAAGTNLVSVAATNAAGKLSTTNLTVVKSDVVLTIYAVPEDQLYLATVTVQGSVTGPTNAVWVNGVQADVDSGTGVWTATNVPVTSGGTAIFTATAYPPDEAPSGNSGGQGCNLSTANSCDQTLIEDKPPKVYVQHYDLGYGSRVGAYTILRLVPAQENLTMNWTKDACGASETYDWLLAFGYPTNVVAGNVAITWPADTYPPTLPGQATSFGTNNLPPVGPPNLPMEQCSIKGTGYFYNLVDAKIESANYTRAAKTVVMLFTGGKEGIEEERLHELDVNLFARAFKWWFGGGGSLDLSDIAPGATAGVFGEVGPDDKAYKVLADGKDVVITPEKTGVENQGGGLPGDFPFSLRINWSGNITDSNVTAIVGQKITLSCSLVGPPGSPPPPPITNYQWTVPSTALSNFFVSSDGLQTNGYPVPLTEKTSNTVRFCWVDPGAKLVTCKATAAGQEMSAKTTFNVKRPNATLTATIQAGVEVYNNKLRFQSSFIDGITFMIRDKDTAGDWEYIQTGHELFRYQDAVSGKWDRCEGTGLDTVYPNPRDRDSPFTDLPSPYSHVTATGSFTTYLAFRPTASDVLVPIREISWSWDGHAATNGNGEWVGGGTANVDPNDTEAPPTISWTNNIMTTLPNVVPEN